MLIIISIHAPAWGATGMILEDEIGFLISIHAPAWGATGRSAVRKSVPVYFNPRSRVGSDSKNKQSIMLENQYSQRYSYTTAKKR